MNAMSQGKEKKWGKVTGVWLIMPKNISAPRKAHDAEQLRGLPGYRRRRIPNLLKTFSGLKKTLMQKGATSDILLRAPAPFERLADETHHKQR